MKSIKKYSTLFIFLFLSIHVCSQTPSFAWAYAWGGLENDITKSICIDKVGNVYSIGRFSGSISIGLGNNTFNLNSLGEQDIFITKTDASGKFLWVKQIGGILNDWGNSLVVDDSGYVYITGLFQDTVDFDTGKDVFNLIAVDRSDIYVTKLDSSGSFVWAKQFGGTLGSGGYALQVDESGNVFTTGVFTGTVDFDPGSGVYNLSSNSSSFCIFISKLDKNGDFVWTKQIGGSGLDFGNAIELDRSGNIYISGNFERTVDFDPGVAVVSLTSKGMEDIYILKLNATGDYKWVRRFGGTDRDLCYDIVLDTLGNVYTTGYFMDVVDFDPGSPVNNLTAAYKDLFISKLDSLGNHIWVKQVKGNNFCIGMSIALDDLNNVYTTGMFVNSTDFNPGNSNFSMSSAGNQDVFILKLDTGGSFLWSKRFGGNGSDEGISIAIDAYHNIYTAGAFYNTVDFDPNNGSYNLNSSGKFDAFIHKMNFYSVSINETPYDYIVPAFPNPTSGKFNVTFREQLNNATYTLTNIQGKKIMEGSDLNGTEISFDITHMAEGTYLLKVQTLKNNYNFKIIKTN